MRKIASVGTVLLLGAGLVGAAAPAQAQPIACSPNISWACGIVGRGVQFVEDEAGRVPGHVQSAINTVHSLYDFVDATVECVVFQNCP